MNSTELVHNLTNRTNPRRDSARRAAPLFSTELAGPVRQAILRARHHLLAEQHSDGTWCGLQSTDASLAALAIFWLAYTDRAQSELAQQCAATILEMQRPEGGWSRTPGCVADLSISVQAYFGLKLVGVDPTSTCLLRARNVIRKLGGADAADETTRTMMALFGQISYETCGRVASEHPLFDAEQAGPTSLATILTRKPVCSISCERGVRELFIKRPCDWPIAKGSAQWQVRNFEVEKIEELPFDELIWHMIALHANGASLDDNQIAACEQRFSELVVVDEDNYAAWPNCTARPLTDTAITAKSLLASGLFPDHDAISAALGALLRNTGDNRGATLQLCSILSALHIANAPADSGGNLPPELDVFGDWSCSAEDWKSELAPAEPNTAGEAIVAGLCSELIARQNSDGGWGDAACGISDPTVAGSVLEAIAKFEGDAARLSIGRAVEYLRESQRGDGSWLSISGMEQILATSSAIRGLAAAGADPADDTIAGGLNWLVVEQQSDGGWRDGSDDANPSPTSYAVLAFVAAGESNHKACRRGIHFLTDAQRDDGRWKDTNFAAYDVALDRWIHNELHSTASPLLALSRWVVAATVGQTAADPEMSLRLVGVSADE